MANSPCDPCNALSPLRNDPPRKKPYIEFEQNASGYFWRLRDARGNCLAKAPRDYDSVVEMQLDLQQVKGIIKFATHVWI